jgi:serpin B
MLDYREGPGRFVLWSSLLAVAAALSGCSGETEPAREARAVTQVTPELEPVVAGNNAFGWSLYRAAASAPGNLFFSPFSVSAAFGMTSAGAGGETAAEMNEVLKIGSESYHAEFGALTRDLGGEHVGRGYQLYIANRVFGQAGLPFERDFLDLTSEAYAAPLAEVDYLAELEQARVTINGWVSEQTQTKIPELFVPGVLDSGTVMVLANAIYFKADWAEQFEVRQTAPAPFELAGGGTVDVPMMHRTGTFRVATREGVSLLEMDYKDNELSMVVLLPAARDALPALEASLSGEWVNALIAEAQSTQVSVSFPRFELEHELPLKELLATLGMQRAFDFRRADFSRLLDPAVSPLYIAAAVHKAFVKVDEQGTEAAAATGVGVAAASATPSFVANRPFLYLIRDRLTGSVLFLGRVVDPTRRAN